MASIDNLEIEISADASKAIKAYRSLATSMKSIQGVATGNANVLKGLAIRINEFAKHTASATHQISTLASALKEVGKGTTNTSKTVKEYGNLAKSLNNIQTFASGNSNALKGLAIRINDFAKHTASATNQVSNLARSLSEVGKGTSDASKTAKSYNALANSLTKIDKVASGENDVFKRLASLVIEFAEQTKEATDQLERLASSLGAIKPTNLDKTTKSAEKMAETIKGIGNSDTSANLDATSESIDKVGDSSKDSAKEVEKMGNKVNVAGTKAKKSSGGFKHFLKQIKDIIKYRVVRRILTEIGTSMKDGLKNLYKYSEAMKSLDSTKAQKGMDKLATKWLQVKNTLGVTLMSLINMAMPYILKLANVLIKIANTFNKYMAALSGADTWTKAIKLQTKAFKDETKQAEELKYTLLGFDEINALSDDSKDDGNDELDETKMFKEVAVPEELKNKFAPFRQSIENITQSFKDIFKYLKKIWKSDLVQAIITFTLQTTLGAIETVVDLIADALGVIDAIVNGDWDKVLPRLGKMVVNLLLNIMGVIAPALDFIGKLFGYDTKFTKFVTDLKGGFDKFWETDMTDSSGIDEVLGKFKAGTYGSTKELIAEAGALTAIATIVGTVIGLVKTLTSKYKKKNQALGEQTEKTTEDAKETEGLGSTIGALATVAGLAISGIGGLSDALSENKGEAKKDKNKVGGLATAFETLGEKVGDVKDAIANFTQTSLANIKDWAKDSLAEIKNVINALNGVSTAPSTRPSSSYDTVPDSVKNVLNNKNTNEDTSKNTSNAPAYNQGIVGSKENKETNNNKTSNAPAYNQGVVGSEKSWSNMTLSQLSKLLEDKGLSHLSTMIGKDPSFKTDAQRKSAMIKMLKMNQEGVSSLDLMTSKYNKLTLDQRFSNIFPTFKKFLDGIYDNFSTAGTGYWKEGLNVGISAFLNALGLPGISFASGGFPSIGQMFIANEAGPELIGQMGKRNVVANNQQIVDGIKQGVIEAMMLTSSSSKQNTSPVNEVVFKVDSETLYRMTKRGEQKYNGRYTTSVAF